jgi:hypothetical protein
MVIPAQQTVSPSHCEELCDEAIQYESSQRPGRRPGIIIFSLRPFAKLMMMRYGVSDCRAPRGRSQWPKTIATLSGKRESVIEKCGWGAESSQLYGICVSSAGMRTGPVKKRNIRAVFSTPAHARERRTNCLLFVPPIHKQVTVNLTVVRFECARLWLKICWLRYVLKYGFQHKMQSDYRAKIWNQTKFDFIYNVFNWLEFKMKSHAGIGWSVFEAAGYPISDQKKYNLILLYIVAEYVPFWDGWFWIYDGSPQRHRDHRDFFRTQIYSEKHRFFGTNIKKIDNLKRDLWQSVEIRVLLFFY